MLPHSISSGPGPQELTADLLQRRSMTAGFSAWELALAERRDIKLSPLAERFCSAGVALKAGGFFRFSAAEGAAW